MLLPAPFRPISATLSPGGSVRSSPRSTVGPSSISSHTPRSASAAARPAVAPARPPALPARRARGRGRRRRQPGGAQPGLRLLHRGGALGEPGEREHPGGRGGQHGHRRGGPVEVLARRRVAGHPAVHQRDHAVGGGQAALEPVLGHHHRGAPVLVEAPQQPDQLVAGHGVELRGGLVEQQQLGAVDHRGGDRHALQLAAGQRVGAAAEQMRHAEGQRGLLHRSRHGGRRLAAMLERQLQLGAHAAHHHLALGFLEDRAAHRGQLARPVLAHVEPGHLELPARLAAVEVRHEPAERPQQRRLAGARHPGQHGEGPRLELERDVAERGTAVALGVGVAEAAGTRDRISHRPTPSRAARPANGARPSRTNAAASPHSAGPKARSSVG